MGEVDLDVQLAGMCRWDWLGPVLLAELTDKEGSQQTETLPPCGLAAVALFQCLRGASLYPEAFLKRNENSVVTDGIKNG